MKKFVLIFLCISMGFFLCFAGVKYMTACHRLSCIHFDGDTSIGMKDIYEERDVTVFRALYTVSKPSGLVRVDIRGDVNAQKVDEYIRGRITRMKALYDNHRSSYPGLLSDEITCGESLKPAYTSFLSESGVRISQITGYLNDRLVFGSCSKDQVVYKGMKLLFACPMRKQFYDIEFISPVESFSQEKYAALARSVSCR